MSANSQAGPGLTAEAFPSPWVEQGIGKEQMETFSPWPALIGHMAVPSGLTS